MTANPNNPGECCQELADALLMMYEQYCTDGHDFMSAGEAASTVLGMRGYATFDEAGRLLKILERPSALKDLYLLCNCGGTETEQPHLKNCAAVLAPKDTQSTSTIRKSLTVAPPPTGAQATVQDGVQVAGAQEWEKEFEIQFPSHGTPVIEAGADELLAFIRRQITAAEERGKEDEAVRCAKHCEQAVVAHHKKVVEMMYMPNHVVNGKNIIHAKDEIYCCIECYDDQVQQEYRQKVLTALTTIDPEKLHSSSDTSVS